MQRELGPVQGSRHTTVNGLDPLDLLQSNTFRTEKALRSQTEEFIVLGRSIGKVSLEYTASCFNRGGDSHSAKPLLVSVLGVSGIQPPDP